MTKRDSRGRFIKGQSGNMKGRPKSVPVTEEDSKKLGDDPVETLKWLLRTASTRAEKRQAALDLIDYVKPRLKAVEIKEQKDSKIEIKWILPESQLTGKEQELKQVEESSKEIQGEIEGEVVGESTEMRQLLEKAEEILEDNK